MMTFHMGIVNHVTSELQRIERVEVTEGHVTIPFHHEILDVSDDEGCLSSILGKRAVYYYLRRHWSRASWRKSLASANHEQN